MKGRLFAGLDVSTQSCKLVIIDDDSKKVLFVDSIQYDDDLPQYKTRQGSIQGLEEGVSESDPRMWVDAVNTVFSRMCKAKIPSRRIRCISVSGQQHGLVSLDENGRLTRERSKLWNDFSTGEECSILTEKIGGPARMVKEVGNTQRTGYTASKIYHMFRKEREKYDRTATFFLVHNYINWYLTGAEKGGAIVMEPGDVSGMALWNPVTRRWSSKVIRAIDPGLAKKLPVVRDSDRSIGRISSALSEKYGFDVECEVDAGCGDNMYGAIGTGNVTNGMITISLGTSGTVYSYMEQPFVDETGEIAAFCDSTGHYLPLLCVSNMANGYDTILETYKLTHRDYQKIILSTQVGNDGIVMVPWFMGERTPDLPLAAPCLFGASPDYMDARHMCRAVLEGHIQNLYDGFLKMKTAAREIRLTGGLSKSEAWCQTIADVFEAETVPVEGEGAALGAALHACWVWRKSHETECRIQDIITPYITLKEKDRKKPNPSHVRIYRLQKELYHALSLLLQGKKAKDPFTLRSALTAETSKSG